jgi:predicted dehydrogenase
VDQIDFVAIRDVLRAGPVRTFHGSVALIGGGRWARVLLSELCEVLPDQVSIVVYSKRNAAGMRSWLTAQPNLAAHRSIEITDNPDKLSQASAAILASRARDNTIYAARCLSLNQHVFIEKPFAIDLATGRNLITLAATKQRVLAVGLELFFASYLHVFRAGLPARFTSEDELLVTWTDPGDDQRYGEVKRYDSSTSVVEDVFPHLWSLLALLCREKRWLIEEVCTLRGGARVELRLRANLVKATLVMERDAPQRARRIEYSQGGRVSRTLDFALEPGSIALANGERIEDPLWTSVPRPLRSELTHFFAATQGRPSSAMFLASDCVEMLPVIEQATRSARAAQLSIVRDAVARGRAEKCDFEVFYALRENVVLDLECCDLRHADTPSAVLQDAVVMLFGELIEAARQLASPGTRDTRALVSGNEISAATANRVLPESRFVQQVLAGLT